MYESRPLAGLAAILLLAAVLGAFATFGFSNTDLANTITRSAEARAKDQQTKIDSEKAQVDLEVYRQQSQLELEKIQIDKEKQSKQAQIDLAQMQDNYQINAEQQRIRVQQQLEFERLVRLSILGGLILIALVLILGFGYRVIKHEQLRVIANEQSKAYQGKLTINPWRDNPAWKREQIRNARQREQQTRIAANTQKVRLSRSANPNSSFSREEYKSNKDLPLAE
jgi:hypothetical protein